MVIGPTNDSGSSVPPTSREGYPVARAHRARNVGEIVVAAIEAVAAIARLAYARHRQRRRAAEIHDALRRFDDRTLHDIGFDRSEIASVAAELTGSAEPTRVRATLADAPERRYWTAFDHFMAERESRASRHGSLLV